MDIQVLEYDGVTDQVTGIDYRLGQIDGVSREQVAQLFEALGVGELVEDDTLVGYNGAEGIFLYYKRNSLLQLTNLNEVACDAVGEVLGVGEFPAEVLRGTAELRFSQGYDPFTEHLRIAEGMRAAERATVASLIGMAREGGGRIYFIG